MTFVWAFMTFGSFPGWFLNSSSNSSSFPVSSLNTSRRLDPDFCHFWTVWTRYLSLISPSTCLFPVTPPGSIRMPSPSPGGQAMVATDVHSSLLDPSCQGRRDLCHLTWNSNGYMSVFKSLKIHPYSKRFKLKCLERLYNKHRFSF